MKGGGREEGGEERKGERGSVQNQINWSPRNGSAAKTQNMSLLLEHRSTCLGIFNYSTHLGLHMTELPVLNLASSLPSDT